MGSSLFLKKRYGVGYNFTFEKAKHRPIGEQPQNEGDEQEGDHVLPQPFSLDKLDEYLKTELSDQVKLLSHVGDEVTY